MNRFFLPGIGCSAFRDDFASTVRMHIKTSLRAIEAIRSRLA